MRKITICGLSLILTSLMCMSITSCSHTMEDVDKKLADGDTIKALSYLEEIAVGNDTTAEQAQTWLINYYATRLQAAKFQNDSLNEAGIKWVEKSATGGNTGHQFFMAQYYCNSPAHKDVKKELAWLKKASDNGHNQAPYIAYVILNDSTSQLFNRNEAMKYIKMSAERGNNEAMFIYGFNLYTGLHINQNQTEGFNWLVKAANDGNSEAACLVAMDYYLGEFVEKNLDLAHKYAGIAGSELDDDVSQSINTEWANKRSREVADLVNSVCRKSRWVKEDFRSGIQHVIAFDNNKMIYGTRGGGDILSAITMHLKSEGANLDGRVIVRTYVAGRAFGGFRGSEDDFDYKMVVLDITPNRLTISNSGRYDGSYRRED